MNPSLYPNRPQLLTNRIGAPALTDPAINRIGMSPNALAAQLKLEDEERKRQHDQKWQGLIGMAGMALPMMLSGGMPLPF